MPHTKEPVRDAMEFLAMVSHDMKTPVKAQLRAVKLLSSGVFGEFSEDVQKLFLNMEASNKYMQCLLDNILNNYRLNNGDLILNKTLNDFRKTLETSLQNAEILFEAKNQKILITYNAKNYSKNYDEIEIQRVLVNLLSNAFEHSSENSCIKINIQDEFNKLKIQITSQKPLIQKIRGSFESLNQLKAGLGLGLVICNRIISAHNGELQNEINSSGEYIASFILP